MKNIARILLATYWVAVGYFPFKLNSYRRYYSEGIGCPKAGDCYVPGSEYLLSLDLLYMTAAVLLWPLACIKLYKVVQGLFARNS